MKVVVEDLAKKELDDIFYYNMQYSLKNAVSTDYAITEHIKYLTNSPYIGRYIPEMSDKQFREIIYKSSRHSRYRIMYYISKKIDTIYIFNIMNCKQDFNRILEMNNYFQNYFEI